MCKRLVVILMFFCAFAFALELEEKVKICGVCGNVVRVTTVVSANTFGSMDLDLRPAPERRDTLKYQIELCRDCGYCWPDIGKERKRESIAQVLNAPLKFDDLAALFARAAEIEIATNQGASFASFMLYMKAAWAEDDAKNDDEAKKYRRQAVEQMTKYMEADQTARITPDNYLIQIDAARRCGDFELAEKLLKTATPMANAGLLRKILVFQKRLIERKDAGRYTVADADI